jgi:hypothetical protein
MNTEIKGPLKKWQGPPPFIPEKKMLKIRQEERYLKTHLLDGRSNK